MNVQEYDIVIIGSGAGGGTVAGQLAPLAREGAKIAVLEAGPHYSTKYLTQREIEMMDLFYNGGAWPSANGHITMSIGEALGGSTLMYTGVTFRIPEEVLEDWDVPGLEIKDLESRFNRLEKEINVIIPDEDMTNDNNRLFAEGCYNLGLSVEKIPLNVKGCEQMGFCNLGCAKGNKQGTLHVQLPESQKQGVELIPNCRVIRIGEQEVIAQVSEAPKGTEPGPWSAGKYRIKAKKIVVAGGTRGSTSLLLQSGFEKEFPALGRYITLHPAMVVNGVYPKRIGNYKGFPKVFYTDHFSHSHHYYIETAFYYPFITTKNTCLWGKDLQYVMKRYDNLMCMLLLIHDDALESNHIFLNKKGVPVMEYSLSDRVIESMVHAQVEAARIFFAAGCEKAIIPCADKILFSEKDLKGKPLESFIKRSNYLPIKVPVASAHLQGGCRMGSSKSDSVTDGYGRVHGHEYLYVADGSLFPKSSHVNPYLTIMALADRVAENLMKELH